VSCALQPAAAEISAGATAAVGTANVVGVSVEDTTASPATAAASAEGGPAEATAATTVAATLPSCGTVAFAFATRLITRLFLHEDGGEPDGSLCHSLPSAQVMPWAVQLPSRPRGPPFEEKSAVRLLPSALASTAHAREPSSSPRTFRVAALTFENTISRAQPGWCGS